MITFLKYLYLFSLCVWVGGMVYFSIFVTFPLFTTYSPHEAGTILAVLFPKYYLFHYILGLLTVGSAYGVGWKPLWPNAARLGLAGTMLVLALVFGLGIGHKVFAAREAMNKAPETQKAVLKADFDVWHTRSVETNFVILILGLVSLGLVGKDWKFEAISPLFPKPAPPSQSAL